MTDHFRRLWALGYRSLIPIIPPAADISEHSSLFKRIGTKQDGRGKTPGTRGRDGKWSSFDWAAYTADEYDLPRWAASGAGVGIKTGQGLGVIDADTMDEALAVLIRDEVRTQLPGLPTRVGRSPKAAYVFRYTGELPYQRIEFGDERVEVLTEGKQFVAEGIHPKTGKPYTWPRALVPFDELPVFTTEQITALLEDLRAKLPAASRVITEGAGSEVNQAALTGPIDAVRAAVAAIPNTSNHFPSRESYRDMGYAIKAALPNDEAAAYEIFEDWCDRWVDGTNEPDVVAADWRRMKPPYRRGASWLYELAETYGHDFDRAQVYFEPIEESPPNPFEEVTAREAKRTDVYPLVTLDEIMRRPPPAWLLRRHVPKVSMGFLYSRPGAGKTFLALDAALTVAAGLQEWHGDSIEADPEAIVLYIVSEGSYGFRNRVKAWLTARDIKSPPDRFLVIERTINFMSPEDIDRLLRTVDSTGRKLALVVVDTVSRAMPGADENLQKEMTLFVHACDRVKDRFQCAVLGVHHAGKSGDMRGSTVLLGAGDFVFKLERAEGRTIGRLHCEKQKDATDGWDEPYAFSTVPLEDGESSLVVERAEMSVGPTVELTPSVAGAVLAAMRAAWDAGEPWSKAAQSGERRAIKRMVADFGFTASAAEELLVVWEGSGTIVSETRDAKRRRVGFKVVGENTPVEPGSPNPFEGSGPDKLSVFD